jgi:hypothetical protein
MDGARELIGRGTALTNLPGLNLITGRVASLPLLVPIRAALIQAIAHVRNGAGDLVAVIHI